MPRKDPRKLVHRLLLRKEQFMLRDPEFLAAAAELEREIPTREEFEDWAQERRWELQTRCRRFAEQWGCTRTSPWLVTKSPCGGGELVSNDDMGVVLLSPPLSRLFVVGIDVAQDLDTIHEELDRWILVTREGWKENARSGRETPPEFFGEYGYGDAYEKLLGEAVAVWDALEKDKLSQAETARRLFKKKDQEAARKDVRRRRDIAHAMIHEKGYRKILPLGEVGASDRWLRDFFRSKGWGPMGWTE